ncbi:PQQ-like beta-propeller repeat protein [Halobaculum sp. CBA1158]|uniref:PQQ-like beta-propeller repeat protein n=1 Tax=Halobaculum sp. CBA1158 TaxID=2904243 RepID=UPI001F1E4EE3|nr:PQQ-like beta-propeller repeat protein [Halobaculum sp. CBA1158]UIO99843.1 PQQ-like beta-propeller repeat protein [Halobaculum sp. CBA1158]
MPSPSSSEAAAADGLSGHARRSLDAVDPCGSRQRGRRSAVALLPELVVVGTAGGDLRAFERDGDGGLGSERWRVAGEEPVVALAPFDGGVLAGTRGERGLLRLVDADGTERWRVEAAADVGSPAKETRFWYPFVAALATDGDRAYAAARRYERRSGGDDGDGETDSARRFESVVYAVEPDGTVAWRSPARASPIALATDGDRLAVAYNRCPEPAAHDAGLVVLDAAAGDERLRWDPRVGVGSDAATPAGRDADSGTADRGRAVGDVALTPDGYAVASHADRRGYLLDRDGGVTATLELGATATCDPADGGEPERAYAYPNHVVAGDGVVAFVLGNTFPVEGRETDARHPAEHTAVGVDPDGTERWRAPVGGFAHHVASDGDALAVPTAQHFRERDPSVHGVRLIDLADGRAQRRRTEGVAAAVALGGEAVAAVEEPVAYHDGDADGHGAYRLHGWGR